MSGLNSTRNLALYDTCPIGAIIAFPSNAIPGGWLECNGQAISRTLYKELFTLVGTAYGAGDGIATFNLPDYRGAFLRGNDNGKGRDPNRQLGTFQDQDVQPHTHGLPGASGTPGDGGYNGYLAPVSPNHLFTSANSGTETRPKNVSVVYCIKVANVIITNLSTVSTYASLTHTTHNGEVSLLQANGYKKFADGLILQWGSSGVQTSWTTVNFPIAFPNALYSLTGFYNGNSPLYWNNAALGNASFQFAVGTSYGTAFWQAIGR